MNSAPTPPVVLSIAGFDPSSGAGVTADIKTIAAHGCYGVTCITALTVQSTSAVRKVEPVRGELVAQTLQELTRDLRFSAVRIGMLASGEVVEAVCKFLKAEKPPNVVLDPILRASHGPALLDASGIERLKKDLLPLADVVTPNLHEAENLTGLQVSNLAQMKQAALRLHTAGCRNVIVTGGHLEKPIDLLSSSSSRDVTPVQHEFVSDRVRSSSTHGTGCAFASALAANLALGKQLQDAVVLSKSYVRTAIARAHPIGKGVGPVNHLYRLEEQPRPSIDVLLPKHGGDQH